MSNYGAFGDRPGPVGPGGPIPGAAAGLPGQDGAAGLPLAPEPEKPEMQRSLLRGNGFSPAVKNFFTLTEVALIPWSMQALILMCFLVGGAHGHTKVLWVIPVVLFALSFFFFRYHYRRRNSGEVALAILCIIAITIGTGVGVFAELKWLREYHRLSQGASYFNVLSSEPAAGKLDATTLVFTDSTLVDTERTYGYLDSNMGAQTLYCVAPISSAEDDASRIQYWAAGIGCCGMRSGFTCGATNNPFAHGAIVYNQETNSLPGFKAAVRGAESLYGITAGDYFLMVNWTADPIGFRNSRWNNTQLMFLIVSGVYLFICIMVAVVLHPQLGGPRPYQKQEPPPPVQPDPAAGYGTMGPPMGPPMGLPMGAMPPMGLPGAPPMGPTGSVVFVGPTGPGSTDPVGPMYPPGTLWRAGLPAGAAAVPAPRRGIFG